MVRNDCLDFMNDPRPLVIHVVYSFDVGGLENGIVNLINRMPPERFRHMIVALTRCVPSFSKACALLCISKAEAGRQMGYRYYPSLAAILAGRPGCAGPKSLGRVEKWLKKVE